MEAEFQLDEVGKCYFAALIYGLSLINEKEQDLERELCDTELDANALIIFVRRKGDLLVHHMQNESEKNMIRWSEVETQQVADECIRLSPGVKPTEKVIAEAQKELPRDRQRTAFSYSTTHKIQTLWGYRAPALETHVPARLNATELNEPESDPLPSVRSAVASQIADQLLGVIQESLSIAAKRLETLSL